MASMRLSGAASSATPSVTSLRVPGGVGTNWVPQSLFASVGSSASATLTQRQSISVSTRKKSDQEALGSVSDCSRRTKFVASLLTSAMVTTCQAESQAVQNKQKVVSKAPSGSREKAFTPKLDDGGIGGGPGGGDDGGGGGGGRGGGGGGGFLFWGLLMLLGFIRDNDAEKPYRGRKPNTKAMKAMKRRQLQV